MSGKYDFTIERNTDVVKTITWKDSTGTVVPLYGYSAKLSMRTTASSATETYVRSTAASTITITPAAGQVSFTIPATDTQTFTALRYVYDLLLTDAGGTKTRLIEGVVTISPEVTR